MKEEISLKKIVVIGPESTGKSTLCEQLARYFNTLWCSEYAREYLLDHGKDYIYDDLLAIAKGQLQLEDEYSEKTRNMKFEILNTENKKKKTSRKKQDSKNKIQETIGKKEKTKNEEQETIN